MTIGEWLVRAEKKLKKEIVTARLDAQVLLSDAISKDRAWLLTHPEAHIEPPVLKMLHGQLSRRLQHEPLAYIRGKSEFYGREFLVTSATLQPRPETETMIDMLKSIKSKKHKLEGKVVIDIGTGSGCIAITAKLEWPTTEVYATEINKDALKIARKNAEILKADVKFLHGNLLTPYTVLNPPPDVFAILANLPYVPDGHTINKAAMQEPAVAIFGGQDGLDVYRQLFEQAQAFTHKPRFILTESLPPQHRGLAEIAKAAGFNLARGADFIQVFEVA